MDLLITGTPTDAGTYWSFPVSVTSGTVTKGARTQFGILSPTPHGLPAGGSTGQALTKTSGADYAAGWTSVQPLDADLTQIAALAPSGDSVLEYNTGAWIDRPLAVFKVDLSFNKTDVGLGNVDNTPDATKPVSTASRGAGHQSPHPPHPQRADRHHLHPGRRRREHDGHPVPTPPPSPSPCHRTPPNPSPSEPKPTTSGSVSASPALPRVAAPPSTPPPA